jgi:hypothetical protein
VKNGWKLKEVGMPAQAERRRRDRRLANDFILMRLFMVI